METVLNRLSMRKPFRPCTHAKCVPLASACAESPRTALGWKSDRRRFVQLFGVFQLIGSGPLDSSDRFGGKGLLLPGVSGVRRGRVTIIGAGVVGLNACVVGVGFGQEI